MTDDVSLALAQSIERLAQMIVTIESSEMGIEACKLGVEQGMWPKSRLDQAEMLLADLRAEKERAVLELAAQLAAWHSTTPL